MGCHRRQNSPISSSSMAMNSLLTSSSECTTILGWIVVLHLSLGLTPCHGKKYPAEKWKQMKIAGTWMFTSHHIDRWTHMLIHPMCFQIIRRRKISIPSSRSGLMVWSPFALANHQRPNPLRCAHQWLMTSANSTSTEIMEILFYYWTTTSRSASPIACRFNL